MLSQPWPQVSLIPTDPQSHYIHLETPYSELRLSADMTELGKDNASPKTNGINGHTVNSTHDSHSKEKNAWETPGTAAFDFRSTISISLSLGIWIFFRYNYTDGKYQQVIP